MGTALLLDAFEPLVEAGPAAVCFSSSAANQVALQGVDADLESLVSDPRAAGFLDAAAARFTDSGLAYAWAKRGVIAVAAQAAVASTRRAGQLDGAGADRHADGSSRGGVTTDDGVDAGKDAPGAAGPARRGGDRRRIPSLRGCVVHLRNRHPGRRRNAAGLSAIPFPASSRGHRLDQVQCRSTTSSSL